MIRRLKRPASLKNINVTTMQLSLRTVTSYLIFLTFGYSSVLGCESKATVQWENKDRSAMQKKIGETISSPEVSNTYKDLTAGLTEDERHLVNSLVTIILERNPSKSDKSKTLSASFKAISSIRNQTNIRDRLPDALVTMAAIARNTDTSLAGLMMAVADAKGEERMDVLTQASHVAKVIEKNESFKSSLEELLPKVPIESLIKVLQQWPLLPADPSQQAAFFITEIGLAGAIGVSDFAQLLQNLSMTGVRDIYYSVVSKIRIDDANASLFVKIINRLPVDGIVDFNYLLDEYHKPNLQPELLKSLNDIFKKSLPLKDSLLSSFFILAKETLKKNEPVMHLNAIMNSIDTLRGEGFFGQLILTNKRITNKEPLTCAIQGHGTDKVKFSFYWTKDNLPLIDWTTPSSNKSHTSQRFNLGDKTQCFVRIFVSESKVAEIAGDLITIKSAPPEFASGEDPTIDTASIKQGRVLEYTVETATDPNEGDLVIYRISAQGKQGSVFQMDIGKIRYTPILSFYGEDEFRYQACDQNGLCSNEKRVIVTVVKSNLPPLIHGITGPPQNVDSTTKSITLTEDLSVYTAPTISIIGEDDEVELGACSATYNVTSSHTDILKNSASTIEISGTFPFCKLKLIPEANKFGNIFITVSLSDFENEPTIKTFPVTIINTNDPPSIVSQAIVGSPSEDVPFKLQITGSDADGDLSCSSNLSYVSQTESTLSGVGAASYGGTWPNCEITFIPKPNAHGAVGILVKLRDSENIESSAIFSFFLNPVDDIPVLQTTGISTLTLSQQSPETTIPLTDLTTATDIDGGGRFVVPVVVRSPTMGSLNFSLGAQMTSNLTYTPSGTLPGSDYFEYRLCDTFEFRNPLSTAVNSACYPALNSAPLRINVTLVNKTPTIVSTGASGTIQIEEDSGTTSISLDSSIDPDGALLGQSLSYVLITSTINKGVLGSMPNTVPSSGHGLVTYAPTLNLNHPASELDSFEYKICDNRSPVPNCTPSKTIYIQVLPVNDAPLMLDAGTTAIPEITRIHTDETGTSIISTQQITLAKFSDPDTTTDGQSVRPILVAAPLNGTLSPHLNEANPNLRVNLSGSLSATTTYTPLADFVGTDSFTYRACDFPASATSDAQKLTCSDLITVKIKVNNTPLPIYKPIGWSYPFAPAPLRTVNYSSLQEDTPAEIQLASVQADTVTPGQTLSYKITMPSSPTSGRFILFDNIDPSKVIGSFSASLPAVAPNQAGKITFIPEANTSGNSKFRYQVCYGNSASDCLDEIEVNLTVTNTPDPPVLIPPSVMMIEENQAAPIVFSFQVTDLDNDVSCSNVTATSNSVLIVQNSSAKLNVSSGTPPNCNLNVTPESHSNGWVTITLAVTDGAGNAASRNFELFVRANNSSPSVQKPNDFTITENTVHPAINANFDIVDADGTARCNQVYVSTNNPQLFPIGSYAVTLNSSSADGKTQSCRIQMTPALNRHGPAQVDLILYDGDLVGSTNFNITVSPVNDAPQISPIGNLTLVEDGVSDPINFAVSDLEEVVNCSMVTATSSNSAVINPSTDILIVGTTVNFCALRIKPAANAFTSGTPVRITLEINDQATVNPLSTQMEFDVTVTAQNDAPTITSVSDILLNEDNSGSAGFEVNDVDNPALNCSNVSSSVPPHSTLPFIDNLIIPTSNISVTNLTGQPKSCLVSISPVADKNGGPVPITLSLTDGIATTSQVFKVTVASVNDAPALILTGSVPVATATSGTSAELVTYTHSQSLLILTEDSLPSSNNITLVRASDGDLSTEANAGQQKLNYLLVRAPMKGTLSSGNTVGFMNLPDNPTPSSTSSIKYTPNANETGSDHFIYKICDSHGITSCSGNVLVELSITAVDDAPILTSPNTFSFTIREDSATNQLSLANAIHPDGLPMTYVISPGENPNHHKGSFSLPATYATNGTVNFEPDTNYFGTDSFRYKICDNRTPTPQCTAEITVNLNIYSVNDIPVLGDVLVPLPGSTVLNDSDSPWTINERNPSTSAEPLLRITLTDIEDSVSCSSISALSSNSLLIPTANITLSGTAPNCTVQATPVHYANGDTIITLSYTDTGSLVTSKKFKVSVAAYDNPTQITAIANQTIAENSATGDIPFTISDLDSIVNCNSVQKESSNTLLITGAGISISGGALQVCSVKVTPEANKNGSAVLKLYIGTSEQTFTVNVTGTDTAPTISPLTRGSNTYSLTNPWITTERNSSSAPEDILSFDVNDVDTANVACVSAVGTFGVSAESSRTDILPNANIEITGAAKSCSLRLTPINFTNGGPVVITLRISDGNTETLRQFNMMIAPANNVPTIDVSGSVPLAAQTSPGSTSGISHSYEHAALVMNEDTLPGNNNITLVKGVDADTLTTLNLMPQQLFYFLVVGPTLGSLSTGNNPGFMNLPENTTPLSGVGIKYTPHTHVSGSDYIIYKICDSFLPTTCSENIKIPITIAPVDDNPILTSTSSTSYVILEDSSPINIILATATHPDGLPLSYQLVAGQSPQHAASPLSFPGTYAVNSFVTYAPAANYFGADDFVYKICDNSSPARCSGDVTVSFNVVAVNDAPSLSAVVSPSNTVLDINTNTWNRSERDPGSGIEPTLTFTLSDVEDTTINCANVIARSSASTLIPNENLTLGGLAPNCTLRATPLNYANGETIISLTYTDNGSLSSTTKFKAVIAAIDNPTVFSNITDQTILQNTSTPELAFSISDVDTAVKCEDVNKSSSNASLITASGILINGGLGTTCTVKVTPLDNTNGTATITLNLNSTNRTFNVSVNSINNAPVISPVSYSGITYNLATVWAIGERGPSSAAEPALTFTISDTDSNIDCMGAGGFNQVYASSSDTTIVPNSNIVVGGSSQNCTVTATPIDYTNGGPITITLTLSDGSSTTTRQFNMKVNPVNVVPTVDVADSIPLASASSGSVGGISYNFAHSSLTINEDFLPFSNNINLVKGVDPDTSSSVNLAPQQLVYMLVRAPTLGTLSTGSFPGFMNFPSGTNPLLGAALKYTPLPQENGVDYFIYKICDSHSTIACSENIRADISIIAADDAPALSTTSIFSVTTSEDITANNVALANATSADNRPLTYSIVTNTVNHLTAISFPASYSHSAVISYTPTNNFSGTDQLVYKICDDRATPLCTANVTINFNISAVNDVPSIGQVKTPGDVALNETTSTWNINERTASSAAEPELSFVFSDVEDSETCNNIIAFSSNSLLLPSSGISVTGTAPNCTMTVTPLNGASGNTTVTLQYTDSGMLTANQKFKVVVVPFDNPPQLSSISNQTISENSVTADLPFTITDLDSSVQCSEVTKDSSNVALIPSAGIFITGGSGQICSVRITPVSNMNGNSLITLSHGASSTTFTVNVTAVNTSPSISEVSQGGNTYTTTHFWSINERKPGDAAELSLAFTIGDADSLIDCTGAGGAFAVTAASGNLNLVPNGNIVVGGSGQNCTLRVTPLDHVNGGPITITLSLNDGVNTATRQFNVMVTPVNNVPIIDVTGSGPLATLVSPQGNDAGITFDYLQSFSMIEDGSAQNITLVKASDVDTSSTLNLAPQKLNYILVTPPTKGVLSSGQVPGYMNFSEATSASLGASLTYTAISNQYGNDHFVYKICDSNSTSACTPHVKVSVTITGVDENPILTSSLITSKVILEDAGASSINLATATSPDGLPLVYFQVPGKGPTNAQNANVYPTAYIENGVVSYTPATHYSGSDQFVYQICDNRAVPRCTDEITVNVTTIAVNDAPIIGSVTTSSNTALNSSTSPWTINERNPTSASEPQHSFSISDVEDTGITCSSVVAHSSHSTLIPTNSIVMSGSAPNCNIRVTPVNFGHGDSDIVLSLRDSGGLTALQSFKVIVNPIDNSAVISTIANQTINQNTSTGNIAFTVSDIDTSVTCADVSSNSSNLALVPLNRITVAGGTSSLCTVTIAPALNQVGESDITLSLGSGGTQTNMTFKVTVNATPSSPSIGEISYSGTIYSLATPWETNERSAGAVAEPVLSFTISDPDSAVDCLGAGGANQVTVTSSHTSLIPNSAIVIGGSGTNCTISVTPVNHGNGWPTVITLGLTDGTNSVTRQFGVKVNPMNSTPEISVTGSVPVAVSNAGTHAGIAYTHEQTLTVAEDSGSTSITLVRGSDPDTSSTLNNAPQQLYFLLVQLPVKGSLSTGNQLGFMNLAEGTSPVSGTSVSYTPHANQTGLDSFLYKICDSASPITCSSVVKASITITSADDSPLLTSSNSSTLVIVEDASSTSIQLATATSSDARPLVYTITTAPSSAAGPLTFPASYSATGTVAYAPAANFAGADLFKYKICDDRTPALCSAEVTVNITVIAQNDGPTLGSVTSPAPSSTPLNDTSSPWTISERNPSSSLEPELSFTLQDTEDTALTCSSVLALSSNSTLIPTANLVIAGTAPNCTLRVTPLNYENGESVLTLILSDNGTMTSLRKFKVVVTAVDNAPTLSSISAQTINENTATETIPFTISDIDSAVTCSAVTISSSNTTLLPVANIVIGGGTGTICSVKATPVAHQNGNSNITLTLGSSTMTYQLSVTAQNSSPTISAITQSGTEYSLSNIWSRTERAAGDAAEPALSFTIDDPDDNINCTGSGGAYGITKTSSNTSLIPAASIVIAGASKTCTVTVTPQNGVNGGPITITLQLSDGTFTATRQFNVMITPYNSLPTIPLDAENTSLLEINPPVSGVKAGISYAYEQEIDPLVVGANDITLLKSADGDTTQVNNTAYQNLVYVLVRAPTAGSLSVGNVPGLMNLPANTDPTAIGTIITYTAPNPTVNNYFIYKICESGSTTRCTPNILVNLRQ